MEKRVVVTMPEEERGLLAEMARRSRCSQAEVVRRLVRETTVQDGIVITMPAVERGLLAQMARRAGVSQAEVIRMLIRETAAAAGIVYHKPAAATATPPTFNAV